LKCKICDRKAINCKYCKFHAEACENIAQNYKAWKKAKKISWKEYLSEIANNPLTGLWAKETAQHLIDAGEKQNVTQS